MSALVLLLLVACHRRDVGREKRGAQPLAVDADASSADAPLKLRPEADTGPAATETFCTDEPVEAVAAAAATIVRTKHYELYAELDPGEAANLARILEASSPALARWFARPAPDRRLKVKMLRDGDAWRAALVADGIKPMEAGGYYEPRTETAYMFRQPGYYFTRVLALHEVIHQFHFLTRHPPSMPHWYVEGIAEYLSRHDWDGRCIRLGVKPLIGVDAPMAEAMETPLDLTALLGGVRPGSRGEAWAIVRFLDTSPTHHERFTSFREAFDAGRHPSFAEAVAPPPSLVAPLAAWLQKSRPPLERIFIDWASVAPGTVEVRTPGVLSFALVDDAHATSHLSVRARKETPKWSVGAVVSYADDHHYVAVLLANDGTVKTFTADGENRWDDIGHAPTSADGIERIAVDIERGDARVTFNGSSLSVPVRAPRLGLAANDTRALFEALDWR